MESIDTALADACADQRPHLLAFAKTGDPAVLSRVHFESCAACSHAIDALEIFPEAPEPRRPYDPAEDPVLNAILVVGGVLGIAIMLTLFIRLAAIPFPERREHTAFTIAMSCLLFLDVWAMTRLNAAQLKRMAKTAPD